MKIFSYLRNSRMETSGNFFTQIRKKLGLRISNKQIYREAFTHSSLNLKGSDGKVISFERLEFLGDALLTTIIAEYLYDYFPEAKEGALTRLRAKIVSRSKLNQIGKNMGLFEFLKASNNQNKFGEDIGVSKELVIERVNLFDNKGNPRTDEVTEDDREHSQWYDRNTM